MKTRGELAGDVGMLIDEAKRLKNALLFDETEIAADDYEDVVAAIEMAEGLIFQSLKIARGEE